MIIGAHSSQAPNRKQAAVPPARTSRPNAHLLRFRFASGIRFLHPKGRAAGFSLGFHIVRKYHAIAIAAALTFCLSVPASAAPLFESDFQSFDVGSRRFRSSSPT